MRGLTLLPWHVRGWAKSQEVGRLGVVGFVAAGVVALFLCHLPQAQTLTWRALFLRSVAYVAVTVGAGIAEVWFFLYMLETKHAVGPALVAKTVGAGWAFLPCVALLLREQSARALPVAVIASAVTAVSLRRLFPAPTDAGEVSSLDAGVVETGELRSLYGLPKEVTHPWRMVAISVGVQAAVIDAFRRELLTACVLLGSCVFALAWWWSGIHRGQVRRWMGNRARLAAVACAILMTALTMVPWVSGAFAGRLQGLLGIASAPAKPPPAPRPMQAGDPASGYVGIVLWPPKEKRTKIVLPTPSTDLGGGAARPVVIKFDGPYWYFKVRGAGPGPHAAVVHGKATEVNIHSTDWRPLLMEAHQPLGAPIDVGCCGGIDVAITNADTRPGAVAVEVHLTDAMAPGRPFESLGERVIASSEGTPARDRAPVDEILHFPVPRMGAVKRFDEITVVFVPAKVKALNGARVSVRSFVLLPR
jgi:hypothetical protein